MTRVAVDAMGGDRAPGEIVRGAVLAQAIGCEIRLVGQPEAIRRELAVAGAVESPTLRVVEARDIVSMDETPSRAIRMRDSSMAVSLNLVRKGEADAAVSAGNSGAMMALAIMTLGKIPGIDRPGIATVFPVPDQGETALLDAGANVDCSPENLCQFALMGNVFSQCVMNVPEPRVGLLSIGEEDCKGNALTKETAALLRSAPIRYVGNVEGRDLFSGKADVIVCDGFVGNVALKVAEGTAEMVQRLLKTEYTDGWWRKILGRISRPVHSSVKRRINYDQYGGAPLLGVNGVAIISHGRSNANAIYNAIKEADEAVRNGVVERIRQAVRDTVAV